MEEQKKIKIAHIVGALTAGGVEAVIYNYFSNINRELYELHYITYNPPEPDMKKKFETLGFHIHQVPQKRKHPLRSCLQVYHILKMNQIQIVHSHMTLMCFVTNLLGRAAGAKVLISHSHLALKDSGAKKVIHGLCKLLSRITATNYFACGEDAAEYLFGKKGKQRAFLLYNAIDLELFSEDQETANAVRQELDLGTGIVIGHVGRFTEQKNHDFLLEIFKKFLCIHPDSKLLLAGNGPELERIMRKAERDFPSKNVRFAGSRQDIYRLLSAMDIFVFPSLYEGLPVVLLEAQAASRAILASDRVDRKTDVTGGICFMSLNESPERWAEKVDEMLKSGIRCYGETMKNGLYDIHKAAGKLDDFYRNAVKNHE